MSHSHQIQLLSQARKAIAEARTIDDVREIRDKAEAVRRYAKSRGECFEIQQGAAEIKIRAERRAGEILAAMPKHNGDPSSHDVIRLADLGVELMQSHRWQRIASVSEDEFEQYINDAISAGRELTTAGVVSLAKHFCNQSRNASLGEESTCDETFASLVNSGRKFGTIYADPPWQYDNQRTRAATENHYPTMTPDEIAAMPIESLAADDAHLHLWTTNAFLFECQRIIEAWGFIYKSIFVWVKPQFGTGNYWRLAHEFLLLGVRGNCPFMDRGQKSWLETDRIGHSKKPEEIRTIIEKVSPGPRLEVFGRRPAQGWSVWGNEVSREAVA